MRAEKRFHMRLEPQRKRKFSVWESGSLDWRGRFLFEACPKFIRLGRCLFFEGFRSCGWEYLLLTRCCVFLRGRLLLSKNFLIRWRDLCCVCASEKD